jgi:chromate reductase, NAD(P)H dehydrogenase (quinone)
MQLLTVCGSLQHRSANRAALVVATSVAVDVGATVVDYEHLAAIPPFDPELDGDHVEAIAVWRRLLETSDAVLVAAPEYAGGLAGAIKNAFDWVVSSGSIYRKPMGVMSAGTSGGEHARRAMVQTLTWQGAYVVAELGISFPRAKSDDTGRFTDAITLDAIFMMTRTLLSAADTPTSRLFEQASEVVRGLGIDAAHVVVADV